VIARPDRLEHRLEAGADPLGELLGRLGPGDGVPALGFDHLEEQRVALRGAYPQLTALPLAEPYLAQIGHDDRLDPDGRRERSGCLGGALQRCHE
jgi:hypothetical protein